jgi:hypothetical protein
LKQILRRSTMMHPDMTAMLARQRVAELAQLAERRCRHDAIGPRVTLRVRTGHVLVRWGTRLGAPPAEPCRPATVAA